MEYWKDIYIDGYRTRYSISVYGNVRNNNTGAIRKKNITDRGYEHIILIVNGIKVDKRVHRLVAEAFIPVRTVGQDQVNHKDGNRSNNNVHNLEWVTCKQNHRHSYDVLKRKSSAQVHDDNLIHEVCKMLEGGCSINNITDELGVSRKVQYDLRKGKSHRNITSQYKLPNINDRLSKVQRLS